MKPKRTFFFITDSDQFDELETGDGHFPEEGWIWFNTTDKKVKINVDGEVHVICDVSV